jgi:hypothetical protein
VRRRGRRGFVMADASAFSMCKAVIKTNIRT